MSRLSRTEKVVLGIAVLGVFVVAGGGYLVKRTGLGARAWQIYRFARRSQSAPGTAELKEVGCSTAFVASLGEVLDLVSAANRHDARLADVDRNLTMVGCSSLTGPNPDCAVVARRFVDATAPSTGFIVFTGPFGAPSAWLGKGKSVDDCSGVYSATGAYEGPLNMQTLERIARH